MARPGAEICYTHPHTVEWGTPQEFFDPLDAEFHFTVDVCATPGNAKCVRYFAPLGLSPATWRCMWDHPAECGAGGCAGCEHRRTPPCAFDGLAQDWSREVCWMNPPYGRAIKSWMCKAHAESLRGATVVCLVPARTDTGWWWDYAMKGEVRFIRGRLRFTGGTHTNPLSVVAPFPNAVVIFRPPESENGHR